jgi:ribosomal protein S18 acetylase RimI-like enzyme
VEQNEIIIRQMTLHDIPTIAEFVAATPLWQRYGVTFESISDRLKKGLENAGTILVADLNNDVLGFVWVAEKGAFARDAYVPLIGVNPNFRSHGVGKILLDYVENKHFGKPKDVFLLVSDFNTEAQRFYNKCGYHEVGRIQDYVLAGVAELVFWKKANPTSADAVVNEK